MPFTLRLWNLAEAEYYRLCAAKEIAVRAEDSALAAGAVSDVCRKTVPEGTVTKIVFSAGLKLWEAPLSLSVEAGEGLLLPRFCTISLSNFLFVKYDDIFFPQ